MNIIMYIMSAYLILMGTLMKAENWPSRIVGKVIPVLIGIAIILYVQIKG